MQFQPKKPDMRLDYGKFDDYCNKYSFGMCCNVVIHHADYSAL